LVRDNLRSEWLKVWQLWKNISLSDVKPDDVHSIALNNFLDSSRADPPVNDLGLRKFYVRIVNDRDFIGTTKPLRALAETEIGSTLSVWRGKQPAVVNSITSKFDTPLSKEEMQMRRTLMKFCAVSWGMWDMMKSKRGLLSFSDMILHAKRTIEQKGIRRSFRHILVDEFQDTDPLQFTMIESLRDYGENSKLFAVGDPKQSIYKFRHADPSLFAHVIALPDTRNIHLDKSFRTREVLLERINGLFARLWPDGISKLPSMKGVKYKPLDSANPDVERSSGTMPGFKIFLLRNDGKAEGNKKILAEHLAAQISSWVNEGLTVWDKSQKLIRPVKFSDFAILTRGRGCFQILEEAFESLGIPSIQDRSKEYFSRGEIGDVICTLRAAANMNDDFSVTGWLMSPFSGVKENDALNKCLMLIDESHRPVDLIKSNLPDAYSKLEYLSVVGENEGAAGILSVLDKNRQWLSCYREKDRLRVLRNVRLALRIAHEFQSSGNATLVSCAEYMTRSVRNNSEYEEPAWHDDNENAVRIGAVHSAKGLEYPVTVIFEDRVRKHTSSDSIMPSRELGISVSALPDEIPGSHDFKSKLSEWNRLLSEQGDSEEEERLFYVACTRAQDSLIFCGLIKPVSKKTNDLTPEGYSETWTQFMLKSIKGMKDAEPEIINPDDNLTVMAVNDDSEVKSLCSVNVVETERALRQFSATSFALYEWCPYAWRRRYRQGINLTWELPDRDNNDDDDVHGGAALGSLAHWVLARWPETNDYAGELDHLLFDKEIIKILPITLRYVWRHGDKESLRKWLMNFALSDLGVKLRDIPKTEKEYRFRLPFENGTVLAGAADMFFGNTVIDYKITAVNEVPPGLYESQMDFYAYVIHEMKKTESVKTCLVFLKENETAEKLITDFDSIRKRISEASRNCASESYNAAENHCNLCPFKKGCVKNAG
ncbi:MAG: UvrD-helicase domain-containing protein, partial [Synergistaceae bacterium]|nr:UvrD-helicase domain-containing protein [Synergistaceae bacterium]